MTVRTSGLKGRFGRDLRSIVALFAYPNRARVLKWFAAGLVFMGISTALLYGLIDLLGLSVPIGTFLTAEICTLLRFVVNHYWVFNQRSPTIKECLHYHVVNVGAFTVWWVMANLLTLLGVHYLLAGIAAVGFSTLISLTSNFLWIWREKQEGELK